MQTTIETKMLYVSDDGKLRSYSEQEILQYEKSLARRNFNKRTKVCEIGDSVIVFKFTEEDLKTFKQLHPDVECWVESNEKEGYFVYIIDERDEPRVYTEGNVLHTLKAYKNMLNDQINIYNKALKTLEKECKTVYDK